MSQQRGVYYVGSAGVSNSFLKKVKQIEVVQKPEAK